MIIKISCENAYFLDILNKNPGTDLGLYLKPLKNGVMVGNCVDAHHYEVIFQDTKDSFQTERGQMDFQSYCNPGVVLQIINQFFSHLIIEKQTYQAKVVSWLDKTYETIDHTPAVIEVPNFYLDSSWYRNGRFLLGKYIKGVSLTHVIGNNYHLKIEAGNLFEAMNLLALIACLIDITNSYPSAYLNEEWYLKYVRIMTNIEHLPYFVFYLFIKKCIRSEKAFETIQPVVEAYFNHEIKFSFTDNYQTRKIEVLKAIGLEHPILDIGCGELQYFKMFRNKGFKRPYFAVDREETFGEIAAKYQRDYPLLTFSTELADIDIDEPVNIIISEVIEHNTVEDSITFLKEVAGLDFLRIIITTPNGDFNQHYELDGNFRHEDHKYEMGQHEFESMIQDIFKDMNVKTYGIGDCIRGTYPTHVAIIDKKN
ncbi:MAG: class I SAM-dependent methyltransferase [Chitinophagales bacterium]|nr:class I SAM-dependent methyltransferase [Chitinophagales bacterium]